ncbi:uncharacterized protein LOC127838878 isoform X2 [Dreissena polymorpha]|uniref:uncharacterized protein LOC127838878 isoform X2 n=1 Tax=Dreissena polymorpha TaxID=45954 RepID=UPI002264C55F|nr:uncharacterized protein LOC127838878 isoform X2 [Dreissena polymorpha]
MGVDIQTYRSRIGSFSFWKGEITTYTDNCSAITNHEECYRNRGYLFTIALVIVMFLSVDQCCLKHRNTAFGDISQNELWNVLEDMLPNGVIKVQLLISGVEPNPGPGCLTDIEADNKHLEGTDACDSDKDKVGKGTLQSNMPSQDVNTHEKLEANTHKRKTYVYFGKVQPCTGSIKVGSIFGTKVFKIGLTTDLQKGLRNKNNSTSNGFAISRILDELCHFGKFVGMEIPPLLYLRQRIAYMVLPSLSWWRKLETSTEKTLPTVVLAFRNEFRQSFFLGDKHTISMLVKHICNTNVSTINFCDIMVANPFGGFHMITCNCASIYPNGQKPELKYSTQVSEDEQQHDRPITEDEPSLDERPSIGHNNASTQFVNQPDNYRFDDAQREPREILQGVQNNAMHVNESNTERFQYMAHTSRYQTAKYASYENEVYRMETFREWPLQQPYPKTLCDAGFFFTGQSYDLVRCFCCGIGLKDFSDMDNPLLEHVKHSSNCPFMVDKFGSRAAIESYKRYILQHPEEIRQRQREIYQQQQGRPVTNYRAKHERFRTLSSRLDTFTHWPLHLSQRPEQLATAGFYYTGVDDHCRCFACDGGLRKWGPGDDSWIEHCRWFPACPYAREIKGDEFINLIQVSADLAETETTSHQHEEINGVMAALTIDDRLVRRIVEKHQVIITYDMGFPVDDFRHAVLELVQQGTREPYIEDIVTRMEVIRERKLPDETLRTQQPIGPQSNETLMLQNQRLKNLLLCHLCHTNQVNALFLPCTHHKYCLDCTQHRDICPDCGRPINQTIRTFMS